MEKREFRNKKYYLDCIIRFEYIASVALVGKVRLIDDTESYIVLHCNVPAPSDFPVSELTKNQVTGQNIDLIEIVVYLGKTNNPLEPPHRNCPFYIGKFYNNVGKGATKYENVKGADEYKDFNGLGRAILCFFLRFLFLNSIVSSNEKVCLFANASRKGSNDKVRLFFNEKGKGEDEDDDEDDSWKLVEYYKTIGFKMANERTESDPTMISTVYKLLTFCQK